MAIEAETTDDAAAPAKKRGKLLVIAAAGLVVVLLAAAGVYFFLQAQRAQPAPGGAAAAAQQGFIFNLPTMTVNLAEDGDTESFMRLTVALEVADQKMMEEIQPRLAKVVDAFQVYLREMRKSDLEGSAGIYRLKEELLRRINVAIYPAQVNAILFREILVQ